MSGARAIRIHAFSRRMKSVCAGDFDFTGAWWRTTTPRRSWRCSCDRAIIAISSRSTRCSPENWRADGRCAGGWSISFCWSKYNAISQSCRVFFSARGRGNLPIPGAENLKPQSPIGPPRPGVSRLRPVRARAFVVRLLPHGPSSAGR